MKLLPIVILIFVYILGFVIGPSIGSGKIVVADQIIEEDMNHDGKTDAWNYTHDKRIIKQELDINFDGKIDSVYVYDENMKVKEETLDTNYDGRMDNWREYEDGELVLDQIDSNLDGRIDVWIYVDRGRIYRIEKDTDFDGIPETVIEY